MGLRDRLKKRVAKAIGRDATSAEPPKASPPPVSTPPPPKRPRRASYRTHQAELIEPAPDTSAPEPDQEVAVEAIAVPAPAAPAPEAAPAAAPEPPAADEVMAKRPIDQELTYTVRLINKDEGLDTEIQVFDGEFVLDAADRCAVDLPSSCRNGGCTVCAGRLLSGTMEMEDQYVLEEEHLEDGFRLLCCAVVTSDAVIETHQDEVVA